VTSRSVRIGLTGPIGCGKSTVAKWLAARGATVIDADVVAREVTAPGSAGHEAILDRFGAAVRAPDGTLDRGALARIVFADPDALRRLEAIVHPLVRPRILAAIDEATNAHAPAVVVEAIKLVDGGLAELCDEVWFVDCAPEVQRQRLIGRGVRCDDADRRIAAQEGLRDRVRDRVTAVDVDTSGSRAETERQVDALWRRVTGSQSG
jgi:dephospho-CoA kinase